MSGGVFFVEVEGDSDAIDTVAMLIAQGRAIINVHRMTADETVRGHEGWWEICHRPSES